MRSSLQDNIVDETYLSLSFVVLMYSMMSGFIIIPSLVPTFLNIVLPLNESRPRSFAIKVEFNVDQEQYFVPIFIYTTAIIVVGISIMVGVDIMHITCTAHACSLFSIVGYVKIISRQHRSLKIV